MEGGLFAKYKHVLEKQQSHKKEICDYIKEKTGYEIQEKEIEIDIKKKTIILHVSSTKKQALKLKKINDVLKDKELTLL